MALDQNQLEKEILSLGTEIFNEVQANPPSVFDPQFYTGKLLNWAMEDEEFKINLFRFVDVLPSLTHASQVVRHAQEYFSPVADRIPGLLQWGLNMNPDSITAKVGAQFIRKQVASMAERFILGETPAQALKTLRKIRKQNLAFTIDLLGEASLSEKEALSYVDRYLELLSTLHQQVPQWPESKSLVANHRGEETPINISVKLSALYSQANAVNTDQSIEILSERLTTILSKAKACDAFVYVDMEDTPYTEIIIETFKRVLTSNEFKDFARCGIVLQAYLRRTEEDLRQLVDWVKKRSVPIAVRLVKGAYWDTETILAQQHGWQIPVWQEKAASDASYEKLSLTLLENYELITPAFGSHNIRSLCHAIQAAQMMNIEPTNYELQALFGMAEPIKKAFVNRGFLVRDYAPIGELIPGMGYLVRRLLENTSNEGFLRLGFRENESPELLLAKPQVLAPDTGTEYLEEAKDFRNVALRDYSLSSARAALQQAIETVRAELKNSPEIVQPIVRGNKQDCSSSLDSFNPADRESCLAKIGLADIKLADNAIAGLKDYFSVWRDTPIAKRAEVLVRTAELMEEQREELTALILLEAAKPWNEADGDIAEAIDFLRYYAQSAQQMWTARKLGDEPGEVNSYFYEPRGVTVVISPWNFPLAIPCGMFSAALVTGNCVALKPAEQTSLIASRMFELFLEAGMPAEAAAFLPARGEDVGAHLVEHPDVSTIVFTGSKNVGLEIVQRASKTTEQQEHVRRVIAEMGGKNAIIVDENADLDEAVKGVVYSAFGYQGQKCSACSRVFVLAPIYEKFIERLHGAVQSIQLGDPALPGTYLGPVIDDEAQTRIRSTVDEAREVCSVIVEGELPAEECADGFYIRPIVFGKIPSDHPILRKEIFGPVLAVVRVDSFEDAIKATNESEFGLTAGVFSRSPQNISYASQQLRVGNLYLNRGCTGALVMRQPFGGAKMSGVGSKAGGPDYLLQFVIPRAITENTMRRGFAPL